MPSIHIKTVDELARQRHAGALLASVFDMLDTFIAPGVTTMQINDRVEAFITDELESRPASKGQYDYPYVLNTSVNEVVCHGIPKTTEHLKCGTIVNVDITLEKNGMIADSSKMYLIGEVSPLARRLVKKTWEAMWLGIKAVKPGARLGDIGYAIQKHVEDNGYSIVREYCGHGIGAEMHEEPQVLNYGKPGTGVELKEGMVFTIEPMVNQGSSKIKTKKDGWTVVTRDKKMSAQWEHTVAVTADGFEVLTLRKDEKVFD
ncbi:type I methionyl aminopeptidase [Enterobacter cloacae]|uniref:type I methionyl aminopeptidase n=1 Tax=Enterobacter quasihormaechei TaxID=2529382 RepID=UPI000C9A6964|nr:type I methionyl aminopeptidase [Enterobacter cloacae]